jgi:hypothetical protein
MKETDMAISDRNKPDNFETTLQPDPMLRTGRASRVWLGTAAVAIAIILIVTFFGLFTSNRNTPQHETSSTVSELPPPSGALKPAQAAPPTGGTTSLAPRADENTSTKH